MKDDKEALEGRKHTLKGEIPEAPLRDQIPKKLAKQLGALNVASIVTNTWNAGNANRAKRLKTQRELLQEFEEFIEPIYDAPYSWSSTLHLPVAYTICRTFHSRMNAALMSQDPPFTVMARKEANMDRAPLVQDLMRYSTKEWANEHTGIEEVVDRWIWNWVTGGRGIVKYRWEQKYSRFIDVVQVQKPGPTQFVVDEQGMEQAQPTLKMVDEEQEVVIPCFVGPSVELVQEEDLLIVGGDGDVDKADSVIHQQFLTASELWTLSDKGIFDEEAVKQVIGGGADMLSSDVTGMNKMERNSISGNGSLDVPYDLDRYRVLEAYVRMDVDGSGINSDIIVWVAANSRALLRATYLFRVSKSGKRPFACIDFHRRTGTENPVGLVELTYSLTKEIDAMHNMKVDFGLMTTMPFGFYRASSSMAQERIPFEPGALIPVDNPQADVYFPNLGSRTAFGFQEEAALYSYIERMTSVSDMSLGVLGAQGAARTASGARIVNSESNTNLDIYLKRLNRGFRKLLHGVFEMLQERVEPGMQFRLFGDDGQNYWKTVRSREEIAGSFDFELEPSSANSNKQIQVDTAQQIYQLVQNPLAIQLGIVTPNEFYAALKNYLQTIGVKDFSKFVKKPEGFSRLFSPEEIANRILAGIDIKLGPEQDLEGFVNYVEYLFTHDEILGTINEEQTVSLARKMKEAQQMMKALQEMAAQQANAQQMQNNAQMSQQQTAPAAANPAVTGGAA
jgi:hypothetical protein